ncbi:ABC transporter ATP-binding protein [Haladaptatus halobius]|uniref:ABC transporter ATP-binding protein n=1 Tax=Haladaptatus halobius TaxID=2884875 RepID=UPI001D0BC7B7|nr:ABC transporter ATP-binding protein [Haladaptatus halobius]
MPEGDVLIDLQGVHKEYDEVTAVDDIDFTIRMGEFFSLVGPSGCGKTTTLRMISGFETPTRGTVSLNGKDMTGVPPNARDTNLVFQHLSLFPHMTVGENVEYGLKKSGVGKAARKRKASEYLELVDLGGFEDRNPNELSGGQQQRVALARALVNEPSVLLFDEPLSSLDRKLRKQMQVELRKIHEKTEGSFFYVTHDQEVAMTLSDRMAVMNDGRIEQVGTPEKIYREPASAFVADFIGDTNLFEGRARTENGTTTIEIGDGNVSFPHEKRVDEGPVTVSIRPEDFSLASNGGTFRGVVTERYFQGDQTNYIVEPDSAPISDVRIVTQGRNTPISRGDRASFDIQRGAAVVFKR